MSHDPELFEVRSGGSHQKEGSMLGSSATPESISNSGVSARSGSRYSSAMHPEPDSTPSARLVTNSKLGLIHAGPLQQMLDDESIEEIWVNAPNRIFFARNGRTELAPIIMSGQQIRDSVERMLSWSNRRVDLSQPFVDARLPNGARLHVVIPDITAEHWTFNIRKRAIRAFNLDDLLNAGSITEEILLILQMLIDVQANIIVSGATQAGKTTVLNCLLGELTPQARLITIEEVFELMPKVADHVALQTRQANLEGEGEVTLRMLVRESLRMRPTNIVIGEVRGAEALDLLLALNSGIPGMASIHANSSLDAIRKISTLPLLAGTNIVREFAIDAVRENIDAVIHCERDSSGNRRVVEISLVDKQNGSERLQVHSLTKWRENHYQIQQLDLDVNKKLEALRTLYKKLSKVSSGDEYEGGP